MKDSSIHVYLLHRFTIVEVSLQSIRLIYFLILEYFKPQVKLCLICTWILKLKT